MKAPWLKCLKVGAIAVLGLALLPLPALPSPQAAPAAVSEIVFIFTLDPTQSEVHWTLDSTLHTVHGTFALKSGTVHFDAASGKAGGFPANSRGRAIPVLLSRWEMDRVLFR